MSEFGRVLRMAMAFRTRIFLSFGCALMVGLFWGTNFAMIYPMVEISFKKKSPTVWLVDQVNESEGQLEKLQGELGEVTEKREGNQVSESELSVLQSQSNHLKNRIAAEQKYLANCNWIEPAVSLLPDDPFNVIIFLVIFLLLGTIGKNFFFCCQSLLTASIVGRTTFQLRKLFFRRTLRMELGSFSKTRSTDLMSRVTSDIGSVSAGVQTVFGTAMREPFKVLACVIGAGFICWRLLLVSLILAPIGAIFITRLSKLLKRANRQAMEGMSQIFGILDEAFSGITAVKAYSMEQAERLRFHKEGKSFYRKSMKIAKYGTLTSPVTDLFGVSIICVSLLIGSYLVLKQETHVLGILLTAKPLSEGSMLTFFVMLAGLSDPARKLVGLYSQLQRATAATDRIFAYIDREPKIKNPSHPIKFNNHTQSIQFKDVDYSYIPGTPVLKNVNLEIKYGESFAIVGPNGCGKSTLLHLLLRFDDPESGSVLIDDINIKDVMQTDLRKQMGLVTQDPILFNDTITGNVRFGSIHATQEQVEAACKQSYADGFIHDKLTEGYNTLVGPRGGTLSGGQRQRLSLARAILRDPPMLLLDEATSQIDLESEHHIHKALEKFKVNRTMVIVTHRLAILSMVDKIVVMDQGEILDVGSHEDLLSRCKYYQRLYELKEVA